MKNHLDYKELLKQQLKQVAEQAAEIEDTEAAYLAGRLDALLAQKQTAASQK